MSASGPFFGPVGLLNSLEVRFRWLSFPGLIRGIISIHFFMFLLLVFQPGAAKIFLFDWEQVRAGEYWRVVSFLALPPILPGGNPVVGLLFMFIILSIGFLINDSLEHAWGSFRISLYVYGLCLCQVLGVLLVHSSGAFGPTLVAALSSNGGILLYESFFLAFATVFPRYEFRLFFILPVQVWVLGAIFGGIQLLTILARLFDGIPGLVYAGYLVLCFLPYLVWAVPTFARWARMRSETATRQANFKAKMTSAGEAFHKCEACGATDQSHPERDFRVTADHRELCDACLEGLADAPDSSQASS